MSDERTQEHQAIAEYLAAEFGGEPLHVGPSWFVVCLDKDERPGCGARKGYHIYRRGDKWEVSGQWPHDSRGQCHCPDNSTTIKVSARRGKEALAAEIRRRLMSDYEAAHAEMMQRVSEWNTDQASQDANRETIAKRYGGRVSPSSEEQVDIPGIHGVRVGGTGNVIIETYGVPLDKALRMLDILTEKKAPVDS